MPLGDVYLAMETGTIDGIVTCPPLILSFKLHEVAKHAVVTTFGCVSEGVIMNKESWKKTPDDLKPVVDEVMSQSFPHHRWINQRSLQEDDERDHGQEGGTL